MTDLANYLGLAKQTVSGLVARTEQRGLVARAPNADDGRATDVFLTSAGAELVERLHLETRRALAPLTGQLSAPDQQVLQSLLERMLISRRG